MTEREPTEEMIMAGINAANRSMPYINDTQMVLAIWKAMQARATPALPYQPDEIPRLVECLKKANEQAEHFERQYYLLCDKVEELESRTPALPQLPEGMAIVPVDLLHDIETDLIMEITNIGRLQALRAIIEEEQP